MTRPDGRTVDEMRAVSLTPGFVPYAEGSCLVEFGDTKVICSATVEDHVPRWLMGKGRGWVTAQYGMLPRSSPERIEREANRGRPSGRTQEIQRLIGRALRAVTDLDSMGESSIIIDCDVLQADGGTRTASITGGFVALAGAFALLQERDKISSSPLIDSVSAISVGMVGGELRLDLNYQEDSTAGVDMNVVVTGAGRLVEVQGTAEHGAFERDELDAMLDLAFKGVGELAIFQQEALGAPATE